MDLSPSHFADLVFLFRQPDPLQYFQDIQASLDQAVSQYASLLRFPGPDPIQRKQIQAGTFKQPFSAKTMRVSAEFQQEAFFLADQLKLSETLCASLLIEAGQHRSNNTPEGLAAGGISESAVVLYYDIRSSLLKSLLRVLELYASPKTDLTFKGMLAAFLTDLTSQQINGAAWAASILTELDRLAAEIATIQSDMNKTAPVSGQPRVSFDKTIQIHRITRLQAERTQLGTILYYLALVGMISTAATRAAIQWLASRTKLDDPAISHVLIATLAALDPSRLSPDEDMLAVARVQDDEMEQPLPPFLQIIFHDAPFLKQLHADISTNKAQWNLPVLRSLLLLQWTLFFSAAVAVNPSLDQDTQIWEETVEADVYHACNDGALDFILSDLLNFDPHRQKSLIDMALLPYYMPKSVGQAQTIELDFRDCLVRQLESLVVNFIATMHSVLRKMKNREEDTRLLGAYATRQGSRRDPQQPAQPKHDIQSFFLVVASIYRLHPDSDASLKFWLAECDPTPARRLNAFVRWASDVRPALNHDDPTSDANNLMLSFFEMLTSLSGFNGGERSATSAFEFLASNSSDQSAGQQSTCSWSVCFGFLGHFANLLQSTAASGNGMLAQARPEQVDIPPDELITMRALVRLCTTIVANSSIAKAALFDSQKYRPVVTIFGLVAHQIDLPLKGDLLDCVAAFAATAIEGQASPTETDIARRTWVSLERSQLLPTLAQSAHGAIESGIVAELEIVETVLETYPATTAFVRLVSALIHRRSPLSSSELPPQNALERFNTVAPLSEKSIPEAFGSPQRRPGIGPYITFVVENVFLGVSKRRFRVEGERWPLVLVCLQTIWRCLLNFDDSADNLGKLSRSCADPATQAALDMVIRLLSHTETLAAVIAIASTPLDTIESPQVSSAMCDSIQTALSILKTVFDLQTVFLNEMMPIILEHSSRLPLVSTYNDLRSVQSFGDSLLGVPGINHSLPRIATLVNSSHENLQISAIQLLNAIALSRDFSVTDSHSTMLHPHARINRLVGFIDSSDESERVSHGFSSLMRSTAPEDSTGQGEILNLLISNTRGDIAAPNVAHYLLGYSFRQEDKSSVEVDDDPNRSCLHGVVDIILSTISSDASFALTEHALHLLVLLARQEATAESTLRFLRTQYDLSTQLVAAMPFSLATSSSTFDTDLEITIGGASFSTASAIPSTVLRAQAWAQQLLMLEANDLTLLGQKDGLRHLMTSLLTFDTRSNKESQDEQQSPALLEISNALAFEWRDMRQPDPVALQFFGNLSFEECLVGGSSGEGVYSLGLVIDVLARRRHELQVKGGLQTAEQQLQAQSEIRSIIGHLEVENTRLSITFAQQQALEAWSNLVTTLLLLPKEAVAEPAILVPSSELLLSTLGLVSQMQDRPDSLETLFEAAFMIVSFVRERQLQDQASTNSIQLLDITAALFDLLATSDLSPKARGMLCSTLTTCLRILLPAVDTEASVQSKQSNTLTHITTIMSSIHNNAHRLLEILCNDAVSGNDVWQIASLNLLEAIYTCAIQTSSSEKLLQILVKQNLLNRLAASIQNSQGDIRGFLMSDTSYVFETKMSLLIRLSSTTLGVERLLEARILAVLTSCDFLNAIPDGVLDLSDRDSFLPSKQERYHQILLASLQLLVACASNSQVPASRTASQTVNLILTFRDSLLSVLHQSLVNPSPVILEEVNHIIRLMRTSLAVLSKDEFASATKFAPLHGAVLLIATQILSQPAAWMTSENQSDSASLPQEIFTYLLASSRIQNSFGPVLLPEPKDNAYTSRQPTIGQLLPFLRRLCAHLIEAASSFGNPVTIEAGDQAIVHVQQNKRHRDPVQDVERDIRKSYFSFLAELTILDLIETLLVLFLRHAEYYYVQERQTAVYLVTEQQSTSQAKQSLLQAFRPVASRLYNDLHLPKAHFSFDVKSHQTLIEQATRCIINILQ